MLERFYPDEYLESAYLIDYEKLAAEGYRGLIYDIDNTLVPHGAPATPEAEALFARLRELGFAVCLLSNNQKGRVELFNRNIHAMYVENAHKPSVKGYRKAMAMMGTGQGDTILIGDQLFTDIYGGKRTGIRTILVRPIHPKEEIQIVLKRYLERIVLFFYRRRQKRR